MKKILTLFLTLFLITTNAYAEYTKFAGFKDGFVFFYDKSSVKRNGNKVEVWNYTNFGEGSIAKSYKVYSMRTLDKFDCTNKTFQHFSIQSFTKPNLEGDMEDLTDPNPKIKYIESSRSPHAILMKLVCKK